MTSARTVALGLLALLALSPAATAGDLPAIRATGTLRVLVVQGSPSFYAADGTGTPGLDREVLEGFARLNRLSLATVWVPSWDALVPSLLAGRGDLIAGGVTVTAQRRQVIDFSSEVMPTRMVVLTRKPGPVVKTVEQLRAERKVGTIRGSSMAEALAGLGIPARNLDDTIPSGHALEALRSGAVSAVLLGTEDALLYQREEPTLQIGMFVGPAASLAFGVRKDQPELRKALDEHVSALRRTPTWSRLVLKYFGDLAPEILRRAQSE